MNKERTLEEIPVQDLKPYRWNAKKHPEEQVQRIAESIRAFGFKVPLIIDENNEIIAGHGRLEAAKQLGLQTVPCIRRTDLTDQQKRAYRLADNKTGSLAEWDENALSLELELITEEDMTRFGFSDSFDISPDEFAEDFSLPDGDKPDQNQISFTLTEEQFSLVEYAAEIALQLSQDIEEEANDKGNALAEIARQYLQEVEG